MPGTLPTNWLDALNWGIQPSANAPAVAETLNTLGVDRIDLRVPPDQYHIGGLQISQVKNLLISMTQWYQGGDRAKVLPLTSNPFTSAEIGFWADNAGYPRFSYQGTVYYLQTSAGGSSVTVSLPTAYPNGSAGPQVLALDATRLGIIAKDNATPIGGTLFGVQKSDGTKFFDVTASLVTTTNPISVNGYTVDPGASVPSNGQVLAYNGTKFVPTTAASGTLATAYTTGASNTDETLLLTSTLGPLYLKDNATPIGTVFKATNSANNSTYALINASGVTALGYLGPSLDCSSAGALSLGISTATSIAVGKSGVTTTVTGGFTQLTGAVSLTGNAASSFTTSSGGLTLTAAAASTWSTSAGALTVDSAAALNLGSTNATSVAVGKSGITTTVTGGLTQLTGAVSLTGNAASSLTTSSGALTLDAAAALNLGNTNATSIAIGNGTITTAVTGTVTVSVNLNPTANNGGSVGVSGTAWGNLWARQHNGVLQTVTYSATPTFNVASGETMLVTLTGNITSWTMTAGNAGEVATIIFIQDATGSRTLAGTPSNVKLAGGAFTLSTAANSRDSITFRYDSTNSIWEEIGRKTQGGGGSGTVTSIATSGGVTGGTITTTGTLSLDLAYAPTWTASHIWLKTGVGTAQTINNSLQNTTAAAAGAQQFSPMLELLGAGWKTNATAASQTVGWGLQTRPVQGAASPTGELVFWSGINGGAYAEVAKFTSIGNGIMAPHFGGYGTAPSISIGNAVQLGTSPSASITGSDSAGVITITVGTTPTAFTTSTTITGATITFNAAYPAAPGCIIVMPAESVAVKDDAGGTVCAARAYADTASTTTTQWVLMFQGTTARAFTGTTHKYYYWVVQ